MYNILLNSGRMFIVFRRRVFCFSDLGLSRDPSGLFQGCDLDNETLTAVSKTIFPPVYVARVAAFVAAFGHNRYIAFVNLRRSTHRWTRFHLCKYVAHVAAFGPKLVQDERKDELNKNGEPGKHHSSLHLCEFKRFWNVKKFNIQDSKRCCQIDIWKLFQEHYVMGPNYIIP